MKTGEQRGLPLIVESEIKEASLVEKQNLATCINTSMSTQDKVIPASYKTNRMDFVIRFATEQDVKLILTFIKELAAYEKLLDKVVANEDILYDSLFKKHQAEVIIGELGGKPVGFALFFHNFSTFLGKANLYLEDLYIREEYRGLGLGKAMFSCLARIATERDCKRLDWWCLDWNEPSIRFYKKMGAKPMADWTVYRVENDALNQLSNQLDNER
jgi:GNAT superfamily N-acetyltransferase